MVSGIDYGRQERGGRESVALAMQAFADEEVPEERCLAHGECDGDGTGGGVLGAGCCCDAVFTGWFPETND